MFNHSGPRAVVESMLAECVPFTQIEDFINELAQPDDVKSALWLFAWAETDHTDRRQTVDMLLHCLAVG